MGDEFKSKQRSAKEVLESPRPKSDPPAPPMVGALDDEYDKWIKKHGEKNYKWLSAKPEIPETWVQESGSGGGGTRYHQSNYYFKGPLESKQEVIDIVHNFYQGFNYDYYEM